ncbi:MAG: hypothetical protein NTW08_02145 [Gammaproteobacteria bacterium]|nr:hypothetical protein [Gammaproteobacteria bacterium]
MPTIPLKEPSSPAEFFEQEFEISRRRKEDLTLHSMLTDISRDALDITINGKSLEQLLASDPEPKVTPIELGHVGSADTDTFPNLDLRLTPKLCAVMNKELDLSLSYIEGKPLPSATRDALALFTQKGPSHLAQNTGKLSMFNKGYVVGPESAVVKMDLSLSQSGVTISSSCDIHHFKISGQGEFGTPVPPPKEGQKPSSPFITFKTAITIPVTNKTLQIDRDNNLMFEPSQLGMQVGQAVLDSSEPKFKPLKEMHGMVMPLVHDEYDALTAETITARSVPVRHDLLMGRILEKHASLQTEGRGHSPVAVYKAHINAPRLQALESAVDCLKNPTLEKIDALRTVETKFGKTMTALIQDVIETSEGTMKQIHTPTAGV